MKPPESLKPRGPGRRFWREVTDMYILSLDEVEVFKRACHVLDRIEELQRIVAAGVISKGSMGQPVVNPAYKEIRIQESLLGRLLSQLELPIEHGTSTSDATGVVSLASRRGSKAARARWAREEG